MITRILKALRNRTFQVITTASYMALLTAAIAFLLHEFHYQATSLILIEVLLATTLALLVERATDSPRSVAFLIAKDLKISLLASGALVIASMFIPLDRAGSDVSILGSSPAAATLFVGLGILLGSNLRRLVADLIAKALFGQPRFYTALCLISLWFLTAAIALLPTHPNAMRPFVFGVAVGVLLHRGLRLRLTRTAAASRRLFEVHSNVPDTLRMAENERTALKLLAAGRNPITKRFNSLRAHLTSCQQNKKFSRYLHLISACVWRLEGRYTDAIKDTQVASYPPQDTLDAQLLLIRALSLEDLDDSADDLIDEILTTLASTSPGRLCPLTRALQARRAAERTIDDERGLIAFNKDSLVSVVASLDLRRGSGVVMDEIQVGEMDELTEFFRGFVAHGVPVTPSWLLDVFGYSLLVAGCPEEARVFLQRCISLDPDYSYGYLHLGDYFLFRTTGTDVGGSKAAPGKTGEWHARACYLLARQIEGSKASRVRRIAQGRLELLEQLFRTPATVKA